MDKKSRHQKAYKTRSSRIKRAQTRPAVIYDSDSSSGDCVDLIEDENSGQSQGESINASHLIEQNSSEEDNSENPNNSLDATTLIESESPATTQELDTSKVRRLNKDSVDLALNVTTSAAGDGNGSEHFAKDHKSFKSNGLAARLQTLVSKRRSKLNFWRYDVKAGLVDEKNRPECVTVEHIHRFSGANVTLLQISRPSDNQACAIVMNNSQDNFGAIKPGDTLDVWLNEEHSMNVCGLHVFTMAAVLNPVR